MAFDLSKLVAQPVDEANATSIKPCPIGDYNARVADLRSGETIDKWFRQVKTKNGDALILRVPFLILDENVKAELKRDNVIVNHDIWVDVDDGGRLMTGEGVNTGIGRLRAALGLNQPGVPFSFAQLAGAGPVKVKVDHRPDDRDPTNKFAEVTRVAAL